MAQDDFSRLIDAFKSELTLWPPSAQGFDESLTKAKMYGDVQEIRLSPAQRSELREIYSEARMEEHMKKGKDD